MKTIIFSDTHLGKKFEPAKFQFLKKIITEADQVIINGDFWEGYEFSFDSFLQSKWKRLFPLLKERNAIYITGNHDLSDWIDSQKAKVFCTDVFQELNINLGGTHCLITHGHLIAPSNELKAKWLANRLVIRTAIFIEKVLVKVLGKFFLKNYYHPFNIKMMEWQKDNLSSDKILITGHSHYQYQQDKFINTGFIRHGYGQYVSVDDSSFQLITIKY